MFIFSGPPVPQELGAMKHVFEDVCSKEWFDPSPEAKADFAAYLKEAYSGDLFEEDLQRMIVERCGQLFYDVDHQHAADYGAFDFS